jgi:hypothetical protein
MPTVSARVIWSTIGSVDPVHKALRSRVHRRVYAWCGLLRRNGSIDSQTLPIPSRYAFLAFGQAPDQNCHRFHSRRHSDRLHLYGAGMHLWGGLVRHASHQPIEVEACKIAEFPRASHGSIQTSLRLYTSDIRQLPRRVPQVRQPAPACRGSVPGPKMVFSNAFSRRLSKPQPGFC